MVNTVNTQFKPFEETSKEGYTAICPACHLKPSPMPSSSLWWCSCHQILRCGTKGWAQKPASALRFFKPPLVFHDAVAPTNSLFDRSHCTVLRASRTSPSNTSGRIIQPNPSGIFKVISPSFVLGFRTTILHLLPTLHFHDAHASAHLRALKHIQKHFKMDDYEVMLKKSLHWSKDP